MQIQNLLPLFFLCCLGCKNTTKEERHEKFDKTKWEIKNDMDDYPYRDKMLKDLMASYKLPGVKIDSLINLVGPPDRSDSGYLFYRIAQERLGFFPLHTKTLVFKLTKDSTVSWAKIHQ